MVRMPRCENEFPSRPVMEISLAHVTEMHGDDKTPRFFLDRDAVIAELRRHGYVVARPIEQMARSA